MSEQEDAAPSSALRLSDAIELLREELLRARAAGAGSEIQLPVESMTVQLEVAATRTRDGKAGFSVPIGWQRDVTQTVTVVFGGPIDRAGNQVKVAQESNQVKVAQESNDIKG